MEIEHNSRESFYRSPYGAQPCGGKVRLRLLVKEAGLPQWVRVIYKCDGENEKFEDMPYVFSLMGASVYEKELCLPPTPCLIWYYFEVCADGHIAYYGNSGNLGGKGVASSDRPQSAYQITVYDDSYKTPDWFKSAIAYQIFPDRFFNGNPDGSFLGDRDDIIKRGWGEMPFYKAEQFGGEYKSNDFFGGNLEGIIAKLPYIQDLGITVIYLNPIFKAASNHKYDTGSYEEIDPMFGDEKTFSRLCAEAKKRGIRIILDGVFNHTGDDSKYFNKYGRYDSVGAYQSKDSPYYSWFRFMDYPDVYESWWGMKTLPQIDEASKELREYLITGENSIVKKWIRLGASGWRLDVVDELPDFFVKELRSAVKEADPEAVIIGEVWEDASNKMAYDERREYFLGHELDSVMNYPLRNALIDFALCRIDANEFSRRIMSLKENYPLPAYHSLLNIISSHDVERIVTLLSGAPSRHEVDRDYQAAFFLNGEALRVARKRTELVMGMLMTMPGVPCLFYGDELGLQGYGDPFCRRTFPWDDMDSVDPDAQMRLWIKSLTTLRKSTRALSVGDIESIYSIGNIYGYIRGDKDERYTVLVNFENTTRDIRLDISRYNIKEMTAVLYTDNCAQTSNFSDDGIFYIKLPAQSIVVYKCE